MLVLPPDTAARKEVLELHARVIRKIPLGTVDFDAVAKKTFGWTPAELEKLVLDASRMAMEEDSEKVTMEHFTRTMDRVEINMKERMDRIHSMIAEMKKMDNINKAFLDDSLKAFSDDSQASGKSRLQGFVDKLGDNVKPVNI